MDRPNNLLLAYPRSGFNWLLLRVLKFINTIIGMPVQDRGEMSRIMSKNSPNVIYQALGGKCVRHWHFGFDPLWTCMYEDPQLNCVPVGQVHDLDITNEIFVLLRDAKSVVNSMYHYMSKYEQPPTVEFAEAIKNVDEFACGPYGVVRYCTYLNHLFTYQQALQSQINFNFIHYPDNFDLASIRWVPKVLGINYDLTDEQCKIVFNATSMKYIKDEASKNHHFGDSPINAGAGIEENRSGRYRRGDDNDYKKYFSETTITYIDQYLNQHCVLPEYRTKYVQL